MSDEPFAVLVLRSRPLRGELAVVAYGPLDRDEADALAAVERETFASEGALVLVVPLSPWPSR